MDAFFSKRIYNRLEELPKIKPSDLTGFLGKLEMVFAQVLREELINFFAGKICGCRTFPPAMIEVNQIVYCLNVSPQTTSLNTITISLLPSTRIDEFTQRTSTIDFNSLGRMTQILLHLPKHFQSLSEPILEIARDVYWLCYSWLNKMVSENISSLKNELVDHLYSYTRCMLESTGQSSLYGLIHFILADSHEKRGFYVTNHDQILVTVPQFQNSNASPLISSGELVSMLYTQQIELEKTFATQTIQNGVATDYVLECAKYKDEMPYYYVAERHIIGPDFCQYPIVTDGKVMLLASYDQRYKSKIAPFLNDYSEEIGNIFCDHRSKFRNLIKAMETDANRSKIFFDLGMYTGGILRSFMEP